MLTSYYGWPVWQGTFLPYGQEWNPQTTVNHYKFTGKERDAETGLDYFGKRYFSGAQGRFTSPDPHNEGAQLFDPQSWNMYSYVGNNPLRYVDPDGQDYHVCIDGQGCQDMTDSQYEQWRKKYKDQIYVSASGRIENRDEQKIGQATWFDGDAVRRIENAQGLLNFFVVNQSLEMLGGAVEVGVARIGARFAPQIARNALKGGLAEKLAEATLRLKGYKIIGKQVTARTSKGIRYVDYIVERGGEYAAIEVKSGNAVRNAGQLAKDAAMETEGAVIGNNGGALQGQTLKLKTIEVRPF